MDLCSRHALRASFPPRGLGRGLLPSPALMLLQKLVPRHSLAASARPSVLPPDPILLRGGSDAVGGSSRALRPNEEEPRDARHPPRRHRVRPPPEVCFSLAGLDHLCLPAVLGKQRLWVIGAKASHGAAAGEGPQ